MLVDYVLESQNAGLLESAVMPFDIYNDAAQQALTVLKQRFLYDEIEAEVLLANGLFLQYWLYLIPYGWNRGFGIVVVVLLNRSF